MSETAEARGFVQGAAWAIALTHRYHIGCGGLLKESGLRYADFVKAGVVESDLEAIKQVCKLERISCAKR